LKNILALGNAASNIVDSFSRYDIYNVYKINNSTQKEKNCYTIPELDSAESYEKLDVASKIKFLSKIKNEATFFVCGASKSSALSLRILEFLHKRGIKIKVVYFHPEIEFLSEEQNLQERAVRNILQEYARSGLFQDLTLVCNKTIENLLSEVSVLEYYDQINKAFCDTFHMIETFKNTKPVMSTFSRLRESCRIKTIGASTINCEDKLFFPFNQEVELIYYYGINENKLREQSGLFRELTNNIKSKIDNEKKAYFGIYPTQYEHDYIYVEYFSPKIQLTEQ
tara:strand:- start:734 stop:1579 length:846 start_codon:yes stop_codon:yes gene_type:complete